MTFARRRSNQMSAKTERSKPDIVAAQQPNKKMHITGTTNVQDFRWKSFFGNFFTMGNFVLDSAHLREYNGGHVGSINGGCPL